MRKLVTPVLFVLSFVAAAALAQSKAYEFRRADVSVQLVELRPNAGPDGGHLLTVYGSVEARDGGLSISRQNTCELNALTTAQRACLATLRTGAVTCWADGEGL